MDGIVNNFIPINLENLDEMDSVLKKHNGKTDQKENLNSSYYNSLKKWISNLKSFHIQKQNKTKSCWKYDSEKGIW